jgi:hypothetical protein
MFEVFRKYVSEVTPYLYVMNLNNLIAYICQAAWDLKKSFADGVGTKVKKKKNHLGILKPLYQ